MVGQCNALVVPVTESHYLTSSQSRNRPMIPLQVIGDTVLVFDINHVKQLRSCGIVGVLAGTLPKAPQQNIFLGLPLRLSTYETVYLVKNEIAFLVDGLKYNALLASSSVKSQISSTFSLPNFRITPDCSFPDPSLDLSSCTIALEDFLAAQKLKNFDENYEAFKTLRSLSHFLMPGLRFGGSFVSYPGDPLRFHSHLIVKTLKKDEAIRLMDIVTSGRLATAVKKAWVLMTPQDSTKKCGKSKSFTVEWAGFG